MVAHSEVLGGARRATAGAVVLAYLHEHVDRLITCGRGVRSDAPRSVHDMRIATRRLLSTLTTYRPLLHREQTDPVRAELKWLGQALGRPRDAEVMHQRMLDLVAVQPDHLDLGPTRDHLDDELTGRHRAALADLHEVLDSDRYLRLLDALEDLVAHPRLTPRAGDRARNQIPTLVGHVVRRVDRAARAVTDTTPQAQDQGLHEVRKHAKRARYAAESAVPVAGKPARRLATRMTSLQTVLGKHQDSVTARALLLDLTRGEHLPAELGFALGVLYAQERACAEDARRAYPQALRRTSTTKVRRWTR